MRVRRPSRLTLLTLALLVLLPALAVLQYRWVGQLSEAERERMQRNVRHAAMQFRESFDGEIARAMMGLQADGALVRDEAWERYADRHAAWARTADHPEMVAAVFLIDADARRVRLRRWNAQARRFQVAAWEGALDAARPHFEAALTAFGGAASRPVRPPAPIADDESLIVLPLVHVQIGAGAEHRVTVSPLAGVFGFTIIQLDVPFIRSRMLSALARRHFGQADGGGYRVAVVDGADPKRVIYRSSPAAPSDPARADVVEPFFAGYGDPVMFIAPRSESGASIRERRSVFVSMYRDAGDAGMLRTRILDGASGRWRLLVQDEHGSLEAAVAGVRQRNLLISFGILLLMGVSVALLALSSRRAQQLARQQMEFVAGVSHELRTPVAVIRSAAENLAHGVVGDASRVRRYGDAIGLEARRLGEMVERVLQFAGIESGRPLACAPLAVAPLIDGAIEAGVPGDSEPFTIERDIAPDLPPVLGDAAMLRSAVQNLVANAAKYGGGDRWIGIRAEAAVTARGREVRITVRDRGRGIAARDLPHVFEPFYRGADAVALQVPGSGLGLALVRRIVEAHGGRVSVATDDGTGAAFTLHVPAAHATADVGPEARYAQPTDEAVAR